ncbi:MAG: porin [Burkholderiaceae bacterium]
MATTAAGSTASSNTSPQPGWLLRRSELRPRNKPAAKRHQASGFFKLGYKNGPIDAGLGYQNEKATDNKFTALSGAYDFGAAALSAGYSSRKGSDANGDDTEFTVGVTVPVGAVKISRRLCVEQNQDRWRHRLQGLRASFRRHLLAVQAHPRTPSARLSTVENGAGVKTKDNTLYALGIRYDF